MPRGRLPGGSIGDPALRGFEEDGSNADIEARTFDPARPRRIIRSEAARKDISAAFPISTPREIRGHLEELYGIDVSPA